MSRRWDLDLLQRSYVGASVSNGALQFNPRMVDRLKGLGLSMRFRGTPLRVSIDDGEMTVLAQAAGFRKPVPVCVGGEVHHLGAGESCVLPLTAQSAARG